MVTWLLQVQTPWSSFDFTVKALVILRQVYLPQPPNDRSLGEIMWNSKGIDGVPLTVMCVSYIMSRVSKAGSPKNRLGSGPRWDTDQWPFSPPKPYLSDIDRSLKNVKIRANNRPVLLRHGEPGTLQLNILSHGRGAGSPNICINMQKSMQILIPINTDHSDW